MAQYEHTQRSSILLIGGFAVSITAAGYGYYLSQHIIAIVSGLLLCALLALFWSLTVRIDDHRLQVRFGPGLIRFNFPLARIRACRTVRNKWWYGWGIRLTPHGWLYNISGLDAVEIEMTGGRVYRIGTDEPDVLSGRINTAITRR